MPKYLSQHGGIAANVPRVWYCKHLSKKQSSWSPMKIKKGKVEYDLSDLQLMARSTVLKDILMSIAAIPMGLIVANATYRVELLVTPAAFWYGYRNIFKLPAMLSNKRILSDLSAYGS